MVYDHLLKIGFLTGSRAFGTNRPDSDYDIVYSIDTTHLIEAVIAGRDKLPSNYFAGYTILDDDDKVINLIPVHPHEFLPWYLATKAMKNTLIDSGIVDPIKKYSVFMGIVSLYKGTIAELRNLDEYSKVRDKILNA